MKVTYNWLKEFVIKISPAFAENHGGLEVTFGKSSDFIFEIEVILIVRIGSVGIARKLLRLQIRG